jgi:hypothetical protein
MYDIKKNIIEANNHLTMYFFSATEKDISHLAEFFKPYCIILFKYTDVLIEMVPLHTLGLRSSALQINYIARSLQEIDEKECTKIINLLASNKNVNHMIYGICYQEKMNMSTIFLSTEKKKKQSLISDPILV